MRDEAGALRWRVRLAGDTHDLEELIGMFTSLDLRVVRDGEEFFLESAGFEGLGTSADVHAEARRLMPLLNGAAKLKQRQFRDVEVDVCVIEFTKSGGRNRAIVTGGSIAPRGTLRHQVISAPTIDARARALAPTILVEGQEVPPKPGSLWTNRWLELAARDADAAEALLIWGSQPHDWVNLYKVFEIVERRADIVGSGWASQNEISRFTRTANNPAAAGANARHARSHVQPPPNPMRSEEGSELIRRILVSWLSSL
jgi:hypothetical protein